MNQKTVSRSPDRRGARASLRGIAIAAGLALAMPAMADDESNAGHFMSDAAVTARVKSALVQTDGVSGLDVEVETNEGVVQLFGFVDDEGEAELAEQVAERQEGVREVKNDIRVKGED